MKKLFQIIGVIAIVGLVLNAMVANERAGRPRLTIVVPANYCGDLVVYIAYDEDRILPDELWDMAVVPSGEDETVLAQLPFPDDGLIISYGATFGAPVPRIERMGVSSWTYGSKQYVLAGHAHCVNPAVILTETTIAAQRGYETIVENQ